MIRRPPRSTLSSSSAASDVYKRQLHRRDSTDGNDEPLLRQLLHQLREAPALFAAEQIFGRRDRVLEEQLRGIGGVQADLVEVPSTPEAIIPLRLNDDQR